MSNVPLLNQLNIGISQEEATRQAESEDRLIATPTPQTEVVSAVASRALSPTAFGNLEFPLLKRQRVTPLPTDDTLFTMGWPDPDSVGVDFNINPSPPINLPTLFSQQLSQDLSSLHALTDSPVPHPQSVSLDDLDATAADLAPQEESSSAHIQPSLSPAIALQPTDSNEGSSPGQNALSLIRAAKRLQQTVIAPVFPEDVYEVLFNIEDRPIKYNGTTAGFISRPPLNDGKEFEVFSMKKNTTFLEPYKEVKPRFKKNEPLLVFNESDRRFYIGYLISIDSAFYTFSKNDNKNDLIRIKTNSTISGNLIEKIFPFSKETGAKLSQKGHNLTPGEQGAFYYDFSNPSAASSSSSSSHSQTKINFSLPPPPNFVQAQSTNLPRKRLPQQMTQPYFLLQENIIRPTIPPEVFKILFSNKRAVTYAYQSLAGTIDGLPHVDTEENTFFYVSLDSGFEKTVGYDNVRPRFNTNECVLAFDQKTNRFYVCNNFRIVNNKYKLDKIYPQLETIEIQKLENIEIQIKVWPTKLVIPIERIIPFSEATEAKLAKLGYHLATDNDGAQYYIFPDQSAAASLPLPITQVPSHVSSSSGPAPQRRPHSLSARPQPPASLDPSDVSSSSDPAPPQWRPHSFGPLPQPPASLDPSDVSSSSGLAPQALTDFQARWSQPLASLDPSHVSSSSNPAPPQWRTHSFGPLPQPPASLDPSHANVSFDGVSSSAQQSADSLDPWPDLSASVAAYDLSSTLQLAASLGAGGQPSSPTADQSLSPAFNNDFTAEDDAALMSNLSLPTVTRPKIPEKVLDILINVKRRVSYEGDTEKNNKGFIQGPPFIDKDGNKWITVKRWKSEKDDIVMPYEKVKPDYISSLRILVLDDDKFYIGYNLKVYPDFYTYNRTSKPGDFTYRVYVASAGKLIEQIFCFPYEAEKAITDLGYIPVKNKDGARHYDFTRSAAASSSSSSQSSAFSGPAPGNLNT